MKIISKFMVIPAVYVAALFTLTNPFIAVAQAQEDTVAAVVNGENVYSSEVERRLKGYKDTDPSKLPYARNVILNELVVQLVIAQYLEREGLQPSSGKITDAINNIRKNIKNDPSTARQTLESLLSARGSSMEQLRRDIGNSIGLRNHFGQKADDTTLMEYFKANKVAFTGEEVRASHILIDTTSLKTKKDYAIAFDKIHKLKGQLDSGADFAELAKANSSCPSAEKGGDIGFFPRKGAAAEPFAEVAFALKVGEISEPVQTQFGFHIITVTDRKEGNEVALEDVREEVKEAYVDDQIEDLVQKLMTEGKIEIKDLN